MYGSKLAKENLEFTMNELFNQEITDILNKIDKKTKETNANLDWNEVRQIADKIEKQTETKSYLSKHNNKVKLNAVLMCITLFLMLLSVFLYFNRIQKQRIRLTDIIQENLNVFVFVTIIQLLFYSLIVAEYIPVNSKMITNIILERFKQK
jgi:hypothetical protein